MRARWNCCRLGLVCCRARHSRRTRSRFAVRARSNSFWPDSTEFAGRTTATRREPFSNVDLMATNAAEQRGMGVDAQLFLLRVRRLDFFQLVLPVSRQSARTGLDSERLLFDVALPCDVGVLPLGRGHQ